MTNEIDNKSANTESDRIQGKITDSDKANNNFKIIDDPNIVKVMLDTNVILAYLNNNSPFHLEAKTSIEGLKAKNICFIISHLVIGEFIAHKDLINNKKISINDCLSILNKFILDLKKNLVGGPSINLNNVIKFYREHSKHRKLTQASFSDFIILAQAAGIKNVSILTCDKKLYSCGKSIFSNRIYYLPNRTPKVKSDYPRLMCDIQNNFK